MSLLQTLEQKTGFSWNLPTSTHSVQRMFFKIKFSNFPVNLWNSQCLRSGLAWGKTKNDITVLWDWTQGITPSLFLSNAHGFISIIFVAFSLNKNFPPYLGKIFGFMEFRLLDNVFQSQKFTINPRKNSPLPPQAQGNR